MLEVIKALGWPHLTFLFAIIFIWVFRRQIAELVSRVTNIDKNGVKVAPIPETQRETQKAEAVQELLLAIGDSIVLRDIESRIYEDLKKRGLETEGATIKVLVKHLAAAQILTGFEQIYNLIFGSQIVLLKKLNEVIGQGLTRERVVDHFNYYKELNVDQLGGWSVEEYLKFMLGRTLIVPKSNVYHITNLGVEFLTWMIRNGRSESRPL